MNLKERDLLQEVKDLGIIDIQVSSDTGVLTRGAIAEAIDAHKRALSFLDFDEIGRQIKADKMSFAGKEDD